MVFGGYLRNVEICILEVMKNNSRMKLEFLKYFWKFVSSNTIILARFNFNPANCVIIFQWLFEFHYRCLSAPKFSVMCMLTLPARFGMGHYWGYRTLRISWRPLLRNSMIICKLKLRRADPIEWSLLFCFKNRDVVVIISFLS